MALLVQLQAPYRISAGTARTSPISAEASTLVQTKCQAPEGVGRQRFRGQGTPFQQKASSPAAQHGESREEKVAEAVDTHSSRSGRGTFCLGRQSEQSREEAGFNSHLPEGLRPAQLGNAGLARSLSL